MRPCFTYSRGPDGPHENFGLVPSEDGLFHTPNMSTDDLAVRADKSHNRHDANRDRVFFVSGTRGAVRVLGSTSVHRRSTGIHGEDLLGYLAMIFGSNDFRSQAEDITNWAKAFGVSSLRAGTRPEDRAGADYVDADLDVVLQTALASTGAQQVLTIIAQIFGSEHGSLIMLEEPEISLHPEAQVRLVEIFAEAIKAGKQLIITTHSHYLLLALTNTIQRGLLNSGDVSVYEVKKEKEQGTTVKELPVSTDGVIKGWVSSFAEVDSRLLTSRRRRLSKPKA